MLRSYRIREGRIEEDADGQAEILLYACPDEGEKRHLVEDLHVDEHTLASALDPDEMARIEFEPEHLAVIIKRPKHYSPVDNFLFKVASVGLFIFEERLIIVVGEDFPLFEGRQFLRVRSIRDVLLKILLRSILHFEGHLKVINACSEELEGEINRAMENRHLLNLFTLEKSLVFYLNAIGSNSRVIEKLRVNAAKIRLSTENVELLEDIAIENGQCYEQAQIYSQVLSGLMDARVSVVSNNLNVLMKTLNIIMVVLMLPTLWLSIFSMNVPIPYQGQRWVFWFILAMAASLTGTLVFLLKRRRW